MLSALGKSALVLSVPCQVSDQPPVWWEMLSALLPTSNTRWPFFSGRVAPSFFNSTSDSRTARRARSRCTSDSGLPANWLADGLCSHRRARSFTRRMRVTASSMRACGISPDFTWAMVLAMKDFHASGTITMSMPALIACGQLSSLQPVTWPMPFQSDTTKPSKPIFSFRATVSRSREPCILP